jgi:osmotically-inducible protein OsmY
MIKHSISVAFVAIVAVLGYSPGLFAQAFGGSSSSGAFGSSGGAFGSSGGAFGSSGGAFGNAGSAFGSSGGAFGSSGGGTGTSGGFGGMGSAGGGTGSSTGSTGFGSSLYGAGGGGQTGYGMPGMAGQASTGMGSRPGMTNGAGANRQTATTGRNNGGGGRRRGGTNGTQQTPTGLQPEQYEYQPRYEVGFAVPAPTVGRVVTDLSRSLGVTTQLSRFSSVQVTLDGGTAVLRGTVNSANDRLLAEQVALLEPAINGVRNELTVAAPPAVPPLAPQQQSTAAPAR